MEDISPRFCLDETLADSLNLASRTERALFWKGVSDIFRRPSEGLPLTCTRMEDGSIECSDGTVHIRLFRDEFDTHVITGWSTSFQAPNTFGRCLSVLKRKVRKSWSFMGELLTSLALCTTPTGGVKLTRAIEDFFIDTDGYLIRHIRGRRYEVVELDRHNIRVQLKIGFDGRAHVEAAEFILASGFRNQNTLH